MQFCGASGNVAEQHAAIDQAFGRAAEYGAAGERGAALLFFLQGIPYNGDDFRRLIEGCLDRFRDIVTISRID